MCEHTPSFSVQHHLHTFTLPLIFKNGCSVVVCLVSFGFVSLGVFCFVLFFVSFRFVFFWVYNPSCLLSHDSVTAALPSPSFTVQYHLHTFPQLLIFKNGHLLSEYRGGPSPESLADWLSLETGARCAPPDVSLFHVQGQNCSCYSSLTPPPSPCG